jgi:hypothetical protein
VTLWDTDAELPVGGIRTYGSAMLAPAINYAQKLAMSNWPFNQGGQSRATTARLRKRSGTNYPHHFEIEKTRIQLEGRTNFTRFQRVWNWLILAVAHGVAALWLTGCNSLPPNTTLDAQQQLILDKQVQPMSRNEVIIAVKECTSSGLRAVMLYGKRKINNYTTRHCGGRYLRP